MLFGLLCGLVVLAFAIKKTWWIEIILAAGLFNTTIQLIGLVQNKKALQQFENHATLSKQEVAQILNQEHEVEDEFI